MSKISELETFKLPEVLVFSVFPSVNLSYIRYIQYTLIPKREGGLNPRTNLQKNHTLFLPVKNLLTNSETRFVFSASLIRQRKYFLQNNWHEYKKRILHDEQMKASWKIFKRISSFYLKKRIQRAHSCQTNLHILLNQR